MTVYDIYTKEVNGKWVAEPVLVTTFHSFIEATSYLEKYAQNCDNPLAMSFYKESSFHFMLGKCETFGVGQRGIARRARSNSRTSTYQLA